MCAKFSDLPTVPRNNQVAVVGFSVVVVKHWLEANWGGTEAETVEDRHSWLASFCWPAQWSFLYSPVLLLGDVTARSELSPPA